MDQLLDFGAPPSNPQQASHQANPLAEFDQLGIFSSPPQQPQTTASNSVAAGSPQLDIFSQPPSQTAAAPTNNDPWAPAPTQQVQAPAPVAAAAAAPAPVAPAPVTAEPAVAPEKPGTLSTTSTTKPESGVQGSGSPEFPSSAPLSEMRSGRDDEDEFIKDPLLKEIKAKFSGRWKLARSDPYDEYLKFIGVGLVTRKLANTSGLEQLIYVWDNELHIEFHSTFYNQVYAFRLNESKEAMVNKTKQSVFCSYEKEKLLLQLTSDDGFSKTCSEERYINDLQELVVIYTCGHKTCRRFFQKLPELPVGPQI